MTNQLNDLDEACMNQNHRERISALMDDVELTSAELDALLADSASAPVWGRYHLIRDAVQNELSSETYLDISSQVALAIDKEPAILAPRQIKKRSPWQSAVGFAMAASVFAVALLGWQQIQSPATNDAVNATAPSFASQPVNLNETQVAPIHRVVSTPSQDDERARLEELLINHSEAVSANGINVMMPYTRVVSARLELPIVEDSTEKRSEQDKDTKKDPLQAETTQGDQE